MSSDPTSSSGKDSESVLITEVVHGDLEFSIRLTVFQKDRNEHRDARRKLGYDLCAKLSLSDKPIEVSLEARSASELTLDTLPDILAISLGVASGIALATGRDHSKFVRNAVKALNWDLFNLVNAPIMLRSEPRITRINPDEVA